MIRSQAARVSSAPPAELSTEKWFVGNWTCEGTQHAMPGAPETKHTDNVTFKMDLGGYWLHYSGSRPTTP